MIRWPRLNKDRWGALLLMVFGLAVLAQSIGYRTGTLTHMGPGFMPSVYGTLIALIGAAVWLTAAPTPPRSADAPRAKAEWRGWLCILGGVFGFIVFTKYAGLIPGTFVSVFVSAMGDRKNKVRDGVLLGLGMCVASWFIFIFCLKMPLASFQWGG